MASGLWPLRLTGRPVPCRPQDNPFVSTSVREFWGRRYNQIVSAILQVRTVASVACGMWGVVKGGAVWAHGPVPQPDRCHAWLHTKEQSKAILFN